MADNDIIVLGAKGMLGSDLVPALRALNLSPTSLDLPDFDICDSSALDIAVTDDSLVINCAAYTNVEKAESEKELAYQVNANAVGQLGRIADKKNAKVLHISTDFVFDGELDRPYTEQDQPNPINVYGASKLAGEKQLLESGCKCAIVRVQWTYGTHGNNFISKLIQLAQSRDTLKVVDDQKGSPTSTKEVAAAVCEMISLPEFPEGLYHFAASGYTTRFEMARLIFYKLGKNIYLQPCKSDEFPSAAKRPLNSSFDCSKISLLLREPIKPWQIPVENFLHELKTHTSG